MKSDIEEFSLLTKSLTSLVRDVVGTARNQRVEYEMEDGKVAVGHQIAVSEGEYSIQRCECPTGKFPLHRHPGVREWVIVLAGDVTFRHHHEDSKKKERVKTHGWARFDPGEPHDVIFHSPSVVLGITIPDAKGYPGVKIEKLNGSGK